MCNLCGTKIQCRRFEVWFSFFNFFTFLFALFINECSVFASLCSNWKSCGAISEKTDWRKKGRKKGRKKQGDEETKSWIWLYMLNSPKTVTIKLIVFRILWILISRTFVHLKLIIMNFQILIWPLHFTNGMVKQMDLVFVKARC